MISIFHVCQEGSLFTQVQSLHCDKLLGWHQKSVIGLLLLHEEGRMVCLTLNFQESKQ